jgi:hypothetical protein
MGGLVSSDNVTKSLRKVQASKRSTGCETLEPVVAALERELGRAIASSFFTTNFTTLKFVRANTSP